MDLCKGYAGSVVLVVPAAALGDESAYAGGVHIARPGQGGAACQARCDQRVA